MKKIVVAVISAIVLIILVGFSVWFLQGSQKPAYAGEAASIVVGVQPLVDASGLVYIADEQNYFHDNGLNVTIKQYNTGLSAVTGTRDGETTLRWLRSSSWSKMC